MDFAVDFVRSGSKTAGNGSKTRKLLIFSQEKIHNKFFMKISRPEKCGKLFL
jgi:hypothetical protein